MKSALPTTAQPALQKRRFSTDEEDSDDESAIVRPEDLVRRWGGVHVRGDSLEPVTARPLEVDQNARRRRRCGVAFAVFVSRSSLWQSRSRRSGGPRRPLVRAAAYPVGAVCIVLVAAALVADVLRALLPAAPRRGRRRPRGAAHAEQRGGHGFLLSCHPPLSRR